MPPSANELFAQARQLDQDDAPLADKQDAARLYQQAADLGHAKAAFNLALMYSQGELGEPDKHKAAELYQQAVDLDYPSAAFNLAQIHRKGELGEPDMHKAAELYQHAASHGLAKAAFNLALMHHTGVLGAPDKHRAAELYQQATDLGHANAAFNLAVLHQDGDLEEGDPATADKWFKRASELGHPTAHLFLPYRGINVLTEQVSDPALREKLARALRALDDCFIATRRSLLLKDETVLSHFTGWRALESMLPVHGGAEVAIGRNVLRQYHVDYMNDPKEGHRLLDFANPEHEKATHVSKQLRKLFDDQYHHHQRHCPSNHALLPSVFICSLTLDSDRLDLWRAYGNDGDGYCLSFAFDGSSQMDAATILQRDNQLAFHQEQKINAGSHVARDEATDRPLANIAPPVLYEIRYRDEDVAATLGKLHAPLTKLEELRPQLANATLQNELDACMAAMLLELLYLYKDEQYVNEREVRAIRMLPLDDPRIRSDERTPGRLYIETNPFLFSTESSIIVGPKVPGKDQLAAIWNLRWRLTKHGFSKTSKVALSQVGYR